MRAVLVPMLFFALVALVMAAPYTGVLLWTWITMMNPHQMTGGWFATFALNSLVILVLASAMLLHRERTLPPLNSLTVVLILFMLWCMLTTFFALSPDITAARADLSIKSMIFALVVAATTNNRVRLQALIWIFVLSYGFFGVKGGAFTILTAGSGNVIGPARTTIEDRNALALVMLMTIPLSYYLFRTSTSRMLRLLLLGIMILNAFAIMGTYSRGGMVGLLVLGLYFWLASSHKLTLAACAMAIGVAGWSVLPDRWMRAHVSPCRKRIRTPRSRAGLTPGGSLSMPPAAGPSASGSRARKTRWCSANIFPIRWRPSTAGAPRTASIFRSWGIMGSSVWACSWP